VSELLTAPGRPEVESWFSDDHWERPLTDLERMRLGETARQVPRDAGSFLDVGCGDGRLLQVLKESGFAGRLLGCDASRAGLRRVEAPAVRCDVERLPFADRSVDCVACCEVLEHLTDEGFTAAVSELRRVARRYVYLTVPHDEALEEGLARCGACALEFHVYGHLRSFRPSEMDSWFPGWTVVRSGVFGRGGRRPYHPRLLRFKQRLLDCWAWAPDVSCPRCGASEFPRNRVAARAAVAAANLLLRPVRSAGGWIYCVLARREDPAS